MQQDRLFHQTRLRLAGWYAGVMGCTLALFGFGTYGVIAEAYGKTIDRGLESVTGILAQQIEPILERPERLSQLANYLRVCLPKAECLPAIAETQPPLTNLTSPADYYIRLLDPEGNPIMVGGIELDELAITPGDQQWRTVTDSQKNRYRQVSLPLHLQDQVWGYVQVGRSLQDLDENLEDLRWMLLLGCPIAVMLVGVTSWWLSELAMQPVYRSYQYMEQFTADVAHELRTPLAAMEATIEADVRLHRKSEGSPGIDRETISVFQRQTARLSQLIKDLLLLSRIDRRELAGRHRLCCLNNLVSDLVEELAFLAVEADIQLSLKIRVQQPVHILGDEGQLYRLVSNLLSNAIQVTPEGGQVTVILDRVDQHALIHVQDTGVGIALEDQARIFDRFYRVGQERSRRTGGSGLGLPIAQAIARMHRGSIQVKSELGKGSVFTLRLPLQ
ncbi:two-component sensor histidine kinase [Leptolyngbya sp. FACHB-541]|uniref:two-component system sensor histidine kinase RppB n=1 Tax=Leptolyngbya sp. FACHB-541 TaxID=2692810 RepID=UPI001683CEC7|nr:two-component system sensor histidine kinase RppB [Leptolyngbya sp. FACHB-541]MBD1999257.1 two-component sensor histidine kinase [Leptolyngbya sp. FACHB-541]